MNTYLFGYQGKRYTLTQLEQFDTWVKVHPEIRRRIIAMVDACPYDLGIGSGWRSTQLQEQVFYSRTYQVACSDPHKYTYQGKCYNLRPGMAPTAPPGSSYHESTDPLGYALAVDMLNMQPAIRWANANDAWYGLKDFGVINGEPWHYQPVEIPNARRNYSPNIHTLNYWILPDTQIARPKDGDTMLRAAKLDSNGSWWIETSPGSGKRVHVSDSKEAALLAAAGIIDVAGARIVHDWAYIGAVPVATLDRYVGAP